MIRLRKQKPLLLVASLLVSINAFAQERPAADGSAGEPPRAGLRVIEVMPGSPADAAGLQPMDAISKYGDFAVVDAASYFVARDAHQKTPSPKLKSSTGAAEKDSRRSFRQVAWELNSTNSVRRIVNCSHCFKDWTC